MPQEYQVEIILPGCRTPNPDFDRSEPISEDNCPNDPLPVGHVITGPDAWKLCFPQFGDTEPRCKPLNDATVAKVEAERQRREARKAAREKELEEAKAESKKVRKARREKRIKDREAKAKANAKK